MPIFKRKSLPPSDIQAFLLDITKGLVTEQFKKLQKDIEDEMTKAIKKQAQDFLTMGLKGRDGRNGWSGLDGKDGRDGIDGKNGIDGEDGLDGKDGTDGKNGKDGSSDTPEKISDKLNTLEEKIEQKVIKGLERRFASLQHSIKEAKSGGGGGGDSTRYIRLSNLLDGSTKTFTIAGAREILGVWGTTFPINHDPTVDWTFN